MTEGRCLCGAVRYRAAGEPIVVALCHCRHCQRQSGSAFSVNALYRDRDVRVEGELRVFEDRGDSGRKVDRCFCPACGSPIQSAIDGGLVAVKVGTMDETPRAVPSVEVWCDSRQGWLELANDLTSFAQEPPR